MKTKTKTRVVFHERIVNDAPRTFTEADFPVGTVAHQGDVMLVRIAALPQSATPRKNRQLAIGNTQGARHMLKAGEVYDCEPSDVVAAIKAACRATIQPQYIGPVIQAVGGKASVVHPEHGNLHFRMDEESTFACVYQRNLDAEEREQPTQD